MKIDIRHAVDPESYSRYNTNELRSRFLISNIFIPGELTMTYSHVDRAVVGGVVPTGGSLELTANKEEFAADYFAQRREVGIINIGNEGSVIVDGKEYILANLDGIYIGMGAKKIQFSSKDSDTPAKFYWSSYPAHAAYPTSLIKREEVITSSLGTDEQANKRVIYKYIHPDGVKSCQLVMGFTELAEGSIWNTMPPHTHIRRSEIYMYFDLPHDERVFHFMGEPKELRAIVLQNEEAVISPVWSIHAGAGTRAYRFIWGMGGENQAFDDMDFIPLENLQ